MINLDGQNQLFSEDNYLVKSRFDYNFTIGSPVTPPVEPALLQEDGFLLEQEDGSKILLELTQPSFRRRVDGGYRLKVDNGLRLKVV